MSFSLKKDKQGVVVVGVDGQLIVGNRQELKQKVLDTLEAVARSSSSTSPRPATSTPPASASWCRSRRRSASRVGTWRLCGLNEDLQTLFELTSGHASSPSRAPRGGARRLLARDHAAAPAAPPPAPPGSPAGAGR